MSNTAIIKHFQRISGKHARRALDKELAKNFNDVISDCVISSAVFRQSKTLLSYCPFGGETDTGNINIQALRSGKTLAFPVCVKGGDMIAAVPYGWSAMEAGMYGITEPDLERSRVLRPSEIDIVIVPCVAFNGASRMRIGMGQGYYDRYLPQCVNALSIGIAFEVQHITDICFEEWDVRLDMIVTESRWY